MQILENTIIKNYSNMRVGGQAKRLILIEDKNELIDIFQKYDDIFVLGNGTNVLFGDDYIDRTFVCVKNLNKFKVLEDDRLYIESGASIKNILDLMSENDWSGIESLVGIPGSLGGMIYMNGGAFGTEIFDRIESVEILDENYNILTLAKENLKFSYRYTEFQEKNCVILGATFKFDKGFDKAKVKEIKELREFKHPLDKPSLGSTFKNPEGDFAARLISECNLKGYQVGGAQIANKHPNFILNLGTATCKDIEELLCTIKKQVKEKFSIDLHEEIIKVK